MKGDNSFTQCQTNSYANINGEHKRPQPTLFQSSLNIEGKASQGKKRSRSYWEARDHIMSERKRRQDMAEKFIALSALIPGLKKVSVHVNFFFIYHLPIMHHSIHQFWFNIRKLATQTNWKVGVNWWHVDFVNLQLALFNGLKFFINFGLKETAVENYRNELRKSN